MAVVGVCSVVVLEVGDPRFLAGMASSKMPSLSDIKCSSVPVEAVLLAVRDSGYKTTCVMPPE